MAVCLIIIFILLFVDRSYIKIGTLICMVCGGPIIDFFTWLLGLLLGQEEPLWSRILMLILGCIILAYGMTIVIKSDAATGFALGGLLGAGTLVCVALVGPVAGIFLPVNEKLINKICKVSEKTE